MKKKFLYLFFTLLLLVSCQPNTNQGKTPSTTKDPNSSIQDKEKEKDNKQGDNFLTGTLYFMKNNFIFSSNPDGSNVKQISTTGGEGKPDSHPSVSRDGKFVVYGLNSAKIYMISSTGGKEKLVANQWYADNPVLSPNYKRVAFDMDYHGNFVIATSFTETGEFETNYSAAYKQRSFPDWSPDGKLIVATELYNISEGFQLVLIDVETKESKLITNDPEHDYFSAAFSPDGKQLAVIKAKMDTENYSLIIMDVGGSNQKELVNIVSHSRPAWSPDGKYIAYEKGESIYIVPVAGGEAKLVLENAKSPAWGK
jgi:Tol biopolymer transport system component